MRTVAEAVAGINAPVATSTSSAGRLLRDMGSHQCRFPLDGRGAEVRFCADEVWVGDWRPGEVNGCYCRFHRNFLDRQPRVVEDEGARHDGCI